MVRFMEFGKAGMGGIGMVWKIGVLQPEVFPAEAVSKGNNICNQEEVIKPEFWGEGDTHGENKGLRG